MGRYSTGDQKIVKLTGTRHAQRSLSDLAEDLVIYCSETPATMVAPPRCDFYPLEIMESKTLIFAFYRWTRICAPNGIFYEGVNGHSDELPYNEPEIFADFSALIECDEATNPSTWPFIYSGPAYVRRQEKKILGKRVGGFPDPAMQQCINQSYLELIARREPAVMRMSAVILPGVNIYDRLWLPIADGTGRISRFVCVVQPITSIFSSTVGE